EDILVDNMLVQAAGSSSKAGRLVAHGLSMDFKQARRARNIPRNLCLKMWPPRTRGYVVSPATRH
ncbi:hypothetical protein, partial [Arcanobacterium haemolyticum]